jgi:hypothetical protein
VLHSVAHKKKELKMQANTLQNFVQRDSEGLLFSIAVNKFFNTCGDGYWSNIAKEVYVESICMYISTENINDEGEEAEYCDGDLAVIYTEDTWDNNAYGLIYTDSLFLQQVKQFLIDAGFNADAVNDITYSEQGMQDDERVSCDAYAFADYVRNTLQVTA